MLLGVFLFRKEDFGSVDFCLEVHVLSLCIHSIFRNNSSSEHQQYVDLDAVDFCLDVRVLSSCIHSIFRNNSSSKHQQDVDLKQCFVFNIKGSWCILIWEEVHVLVHTGMA